MGNKLYFSLLLVFLFFISKTALAGYSRILLSESLPKTKDLRPLGKVDKKEVTKGKVDTKNPTQEKVETDKNTDQKDSEISESEEKEKEDPTQDYKLIAIYLINNQPRALIKNLSMSEDGAVEYRVGDYIDEEQTLSISKISFNPTARIEIIDQNGLSYLVKPLSVVDEKVGGAMAKSSYGVKSVPTYFSGSTSRQKTKKGPAGAENNTTQEPSPLKEKKEEDKAASKETAAKKEENQDSAKAAPQASSAQALQPVPQGASQAAGALPVEKKETQTGTTSKPSTDSLDVSRPANPFGQ